MLTGINPNIDLLEEMVERLGELTEQMVFVGGCATGLLITDKAAPPVRQTIDVDVIADVNLMEYYELGDQLRKKGFFEDSSDNSPICRWTRKELILDVMPIDQSVLGFGSNWFHYAYKNSAKLTLPSGNPISMVTGPEFLACKFSAFSIRGNRDYLMSKDIQDIVSILDGRPEIVDEIKTSQDELKRYLIEEFQLLSRSKEFANYLPGILDRESQNRISIIREGMRVIAELVVS